MASPQNPSRGSRINPGAEQAWVLPPASVRAVEEAFWSRWPRELPETGGLGAASRVRRGRQAPRGAGCSCSPPSCPLALRCSLHLALLRGRTQERCRSIGVLLGRRAAGCAWSRFPGMLMHICGPPPPGLGEQLRLFFLLFFSLFFFLFNDPLGYWPGNSESRDSRGSWEGEKANFRREVAAGRGVRTAGAVQPGCRAGSGPGKLDELIQQRRSWHS